MCVASEYQPVLGKDEGSQVQEARNGLGQVRDYVIAEIEDVQLLQTEELGWNSRELVVLQDHSLECLHAPPGGLAVLQLNCAVPHCLGNL